MLTARIEQMNFSRNWQIRWFLDDEYLRTTTHLCDLVSCYHLVEDMQDRYERGVEVILEGVNDQ